MDHSTLRTVRVTLHMKGYADQPAVFDITIDADGRVREPWDVFGTWAQEEKGRVQTYPVILKPDGEIDFGPGQESYSTNLRDKRLSVGELCTIWSDQEPGAGNEWTYVIASVETLADRLGA